MTKIKRNISKINRKSKRTPAKYNGCLLELKTAKYGLFIDWLTVNCQGVTDFDECKLNCELVDTKTRQFNRVYKISDDNQQLGVLTCDPRNDFIKIADYCQFKFENHLFYTHTLSELKQLKDRIFKELNLTFHGFNRLDIALDFNNRGKKVEQLYKGLISNKYLIGGRPKDFNQYQKLNGYNSTKKGAVTLEGFSLGSRKSNKFCRIYNKMHELEKSGKAYISNQWQKMKIGSNIWRLEYELSNKYLRTIEGLTFDHIFNKDYLFSLFEKALTGHFTFHKKTRAKEVNKMPSVNILNMERVKKGLKVVSQSIKTVKRVLKETLISQKRMVKGLLRRYFSTSQQFEYILPINSILDEFNLHDWYSKKQPYYIDEFIKNSIITNYSSQLFKEHKQLAI